MYGKLWYYELREVCEGIDVKSFLIYGNILYRMILFIWMFIIFYLLCLVYII